MIGDKKMKKQITFILLIFIYVFNPNIYSQQLVPPDWIRQYEGIPIKAALHWDWVEDNPDAVIKMKDAGVNIIHTNIGKALPPESQMHTIDTLGLVVIPVRSRKDFSSPMLNWIQHYTDAKYSVWEAEGNPAYDANLEYDADVMEPKTSGDTLKYIKLKPDFSGEHNIELIKGPYYIQDVNYYASNNDTLKIVPYLASFRLMLEENPLYLDTVQVQGSEPICVIQVTQSYIANTTTTPWQLGCEYPIEDRTLTRADFEELNRFYEFRLDPDNPLFDYRLDSDSCQSAPASQEIDQYTFHSYLGYGEPVPGPRTSRKYIQFKVIWLGKQQYLLSIDKVTVSDERGRELINPLSDAVARIDSQANSLNNYNADSLVTGWLGIDEPVSIDIFEPIKIVTQILDDNSQSKRPLWLPWMGRWDGAWNDSSPNNLGAMKLSPWLEFKKRVGKGNIIQNVYMFDSPCRPDSPQEHKICWTGEDYRSINIWRTAILNYKRAYDLDPYYGVSIQCGAVKNTQANQRNVARHEVLYNANLALMYGAKFLDLYTYFAQRSIDSVNSGLTYHGIVDHQGSITNTIYTDKYEMLRDTLSPRLKGLFGQTLKKLVPKADSLGINAMANYDLNFEYLKRVNLNISPSGAIPSLVDVGSFQLPDEPLDNYFMIINRWYSGQYYNKFKLDFHNLCPYTNWNLKNYVDNTEVTIISDEIGTANSDAYTILVGDALLFSIKPVAEYGGILLADETAGEGITLFDDMIIENGATLYVSGNYYSKANITVKSGGKITALANGKIIFDAGKGIIVDGNVQIYGTANNRLELEFNSGGPGVTVNFGGSLSMSYCDINNAVIGINAEAAGTVNISNVNFTNCQYYGIVLFGFGNGDITPTPTASHNLQM